jgi:flagellar motility protein MotE (MotC chaperone)
MSDDLPEPVVQETDEVAERILGEWDWLKDAQQKDRIELQKMQDELLSLRERFLEEKENRELQENIKVLDKKIRNKTRDLLQVLRK